MSLELSAMPVAVPVSDVLGEMSWLQALDTDVALTLAYMAYGYVFHWLYGRWRPVREESNGQTTMRADLTTG